MLKAPRTFVPAPVLRELEAELLTRIVACIAPVTLARVYCGIVPRWAEEAFERLQVAGTVRELVGGRVEIVGTQSRSDT